jgi:hypothetical protein
MDPHSVILALEQYVAGHFSERVSLAGFLVPKTQVQIRFNNQGTLGEVRYCLKTEVGHHAGVKLMKDFSHSQ